MNAYWDGDFGKKTDETARSWSAVGGVFCGVVGILRLNWCLSKVFLVSKGIFFWVVSGCYEEFPE